MVYQIVFLSSLVLLLSIRGSEGRDLDSWTFSNELDPDYHLQTTVYLKKKTISFEITLGIRDSDINEEPWLGFGVSPKNDLEGADLVIGWMEGNECKHKDYHVNATGNGHPIEDSMNNWKCLASPETERSITLTFSRDFAVENTTEDREIKDEDAYIVWAYGKMFIDETDPEHVPIFHNDTRGYLNINLLQEPKFSSSSRFSCPLVLVGTLMMGLLLIKLVL